MAVITRARWQLLEPLLDRALELSHEELAPWLAELRSESPDLAEELDSLLSGESVADRRGFLANPLDAPLAGVQLGAYTIEQPLGHGGMGSVWLARRTDGRFEGRAAVKLLNLALLSASGQERFRREGSVLARLAHPGIARLLDAGVSASGQPYLILEYVEGQRIDEFVKARALTREATIRLVLQVLSSVTHAHANLIVHRDIKPSNILVTSDGTAKLLDFGIAKLISGESGADSPQLTAEGGRALTPEFTSPEQARGDAVTTATDVYTCGVLLYLLLSGRHPTGEGSRTPTEALSALLTVEPTRLGLGDLDNVLAKALRKAPHDRYQTAAAFADDLQHYLDHEPVSALRDSVAYRMRKFVRRNRVPVIASVVTTLGLIIASVVSIERALEARQQRDAAIFQQQRVKAQLEFQYLMLSSIGDGQVTMRQVLDQGVTLLEREYSRNAPIAASIALALSMAYEELGEEQAHARMLSKAESLAVAAGGESNVFMLSRCVRADDLARTGKASQAMALVDSIRPLLARATPTDAAECLAQLTAVALRREKFDSAASMALDASALMEQAGDTIGMSYISILNAHANALENLKRRREALAIYERIETLMDSTGRDQAISRNIIRNNVGIALSNLGEIRAAEPVLQKTLETFRRGNPDGFVHPAILINYCRTVLFANHLDSAAVWYEQLYGQSKTDAFMRENGAFGMVEVELARGRLDEAARWLEEEKKAAAAMTPPPKWNGLTLTAALMNARGDARGAAAAFDSAVRIMGYYDGKRTYQMRAVLIRAAEAARDAGNAAKAVEYAQAAGTIAFSDSLSETRSGYVGEARYVEATALLAKGDTVAARGAVTRAVPALRFGVGADHPRTRQAESLLARIGR